MHDKNKDIKRFTELRKYLLNGYFLDSFGKSMILPNQKSMVELFCKNNLLVVAVDGLFFIWKTIKVAGRIKQVVVLYSNDCKGICLDGLSIGGPWL